MKPGLVVSTLAVACAASSLGACSTIDRLVAIGEQPALTAIENPTTQPGYKPVQMPMPNRVYMPASQMQAPAR